MLAGRIAYSKMYSFLAIMVRITREYADADM